MKRKEERGFDLLDEKTKRMIENGRHDLLKSYPRSKTAVFGCLFNGTGVRVMTKIIGLGPSTENMYRYKITHSFCRDDSIMEFPCGEPKVVELAINLTDENYSLFIDYHYDFKDYFYINHLKRYAKINNEQ